jgi:hypothetical protein
MEEYFQACSTKHLEFFIEAMDDPGQEDWRIVWRRFPVREGDMP